MGLSVWERAPIECISRDCTTLHQSFGANQRSQALRTWRHLCLVPTSPTRRDLSDAVGNLLPLSHTLILTPPLTLILTFTLTLTPTLALSHTRTLCQPGSVNPTGIQLGYCGIETRLVRCCVFSLQTPIMGPEKLQALVAANEIRRVF